MVNQRNWIFDYLLTFVLYFGEINNFSPKMEIQMRKIFFNNWKCRAGRFHASIVSNNGQNFRTTVKQENSKGHRPLWIHPFFMISRSTHVSVSPNNTIYYFRPFSRHKLQIPTETSRFTVEANERIRLTISAPSHRRFFSFPSRRFFLEIPFHLIIVCIYENQNRQFVRELVDP